MERGLVCTVAVETKERDGRRVLKGAALSVSRDWRLHVAPGGGKSPGWRWPLLGVAVHARFAAEGKASFVFPDGRTLLLSNAPPSDLAAFLQQCSASKRKRDDREDDGSDTTPKRPKKTTANVDDIEPNAEQAGVLAACARGDNVFFTGSAGTGKSFLLRKIIAALPPDVTVAAASTGVAACHISGTTLHAFAGIGGGEATLERCFQMVSKPVAAQKWRKCKHLIIDEISMIDGKYFEKIEQVARHIRKSEKPFGGIQLILCGDFLQLPPVTRKENEKHFCFQTEAWDRCIQKSFELKIVHRQKDTQFASMLNEIRIGRVTEETTKTLRETSSRNVESDGILATVLCTHTEDSRMINESKLKRLSGAESTFTAEDSEPRSSNQLDTLTVAPSKLMLKCGAQVMLSKNVDVSSGLVNGARGVVVRFENGYPVIRLKSRKEYVAKHERWVVKTSDGTLLYRKQIPLILAWAFSIHKSQGLTLDCVEMSLSKIFEAGQAYVALSRAQSLEGLRVLDFDSKQVWANPTVLEFYQRFRRQLYQNQILPLGKHIANKEANKKKGSNLREILKKMSNKPYRSLNFT